MSGAARASDFLVELARAEGPGALEGAIVLVALDRPIDALVRQALALGPHHRGAPGRWSHAFLIAEPYRGPDTKILDATVRDRDGRIRWRGTLAEHLRILSDATVGGGAGSIYEGSVGDYDKGPDDHDQGVTDWGVLWEPTLSEDQRKAVVREARALRDRGITYDFPGLLRELVKMLTGIRLPVSDRRLFCSAFAEAAYRAALGPSGGFAPAALAAAEVTPDDLWYASRGRRAAREAPPAGARA